MKYKLTDNTEQFEGQTLYQIEAIKDFGLVKAGDKGGYVESTDNLSQEGLCWINKTGIACGESSVNGNFIINEMCIVRDNATIFGNGVAQFGTVFKGDLFLLGDGFTSNQIEIDENTKYITLITNGLRLTVFQEEKVICVGIFRHTYQTFLNSLRNTGRYEKYASIVMLVENYLFNDGQ